MGNEKEKILLIDDDQLVNQTIKKFLEFYGYEVKTANNAVDAVSLAAVTAFDLVVSDIRMPGENGIVAIRKIKEIYKEQGIYCGFILVTGYAEEDTPQHAIRLGVDKFIFKPFENEEFLNSVKEELDLSKKAAALRVVSPSAKETRFKKKGELQPDRRVVITGVGVVSPNGIGREVYWNGLKEGKNCTGEITVFDTKEFSSKAGAEIHNFDPTQFGVGRNEVRRMGRTSHLGIVAAQLAVQDSLLKIDEKLTNEIGIILGSAISGLEYVEKDFRALERGGVRRVRPYLGIAGFAGAASSEISRFLGIRGPSYTISTGCTSSTDAMGFSLETIRKGKAEVLITGGADACLTPGILAAFCQMGAVTTWQSDFHRASRPFNKDRDGFVLGEGAWIFVFEDLNHALKRKAKIYGEVVGYGATCDAWHMAKPLPSGEFTAEAIQKSLQDAAISPNQVDLFESYGNGTPVNDSYETGVVKKVFGEHAFKLMMPSIKSMLGHPLGASGGQQVAAALLAFSEGVVHPTINYEIPDPECDLDYVANKARRKDVDVAICSSIAFGAKNSAIAVIKYQ